MELNLNATVSFDATPALLQAVTIFANAFNPSTPVVAQGVQLDAPVDQPAVIEPAKPKSGSRANKPVEQPAVEDSTEAEAHVEKTEDSVDVTAESVRAKALAIRDRGADEKTKVRDLLNHFGGKLSLIPEDKLAEFNALLDEI